MAEMDHGCYSTIGVEIIPGVEFFSMFKGDDGSGWLFQHRIPYNGTYPASAYTPVPMGFLSHQSHLRNG